MEVLCWTDLCYRYSLTLQTFCWHLVYNAITKYGDANMTGSQRDCWLRPVVSSISLRYFLMCSVPSVQSVCSCSMNILAWTWARKLTKLSELPLVLICKLHINCFLINPSRVHNPCSAQQRNTWMQKPGLLKTGVSFLVGQVNHWQEERQKNKYSE